MKVTIDGHGRIVIPKKVRSLLGLSEGTTLNVECSGSELKLTPMEESTGHWENGLFVIDGEIAPGFDYNALLEQIRTRSED